MAKGKPELWVAWKFVMLLLTVTTIWFFAKRGLSGILLGLMGLQIGLTVLNHQFLTKKFIAINWRDYLYATLSPITPALTAALVGYFVADLFYQPLIQLLAGAAVAGCIYAIWIMNYYKTDFSTILRLLKLRT